MIRRADLRFRKGKECEWIVDDLVGEVERRIRSMEIELGALESVTHVPVLISSDAKRLSSIPRLDVDAIVTSPPYLNGTNYFRNTKIELWFLRALSSRIDLPAFRRRTVTSGINDVAAGKGYVAVSKTVEQLGKELEERAYDPRIPRMILSYFSDMKEVIQGLSSQAKPFSPLLMDIGDSSYAGSHVDTPAILAELLREASWDVEREIPLRSRRSKSGQPLRQVLLVARAPRRRRRTKTSRPRLTDKWESFKRDLPHQKGEFAKRNWGNPLHSLCSYQGKLKPSLAHHLVSSFTKPGDNLLDPFGGVGTIAFEAASIGVESWSFDISPVAVPVAAAKLDPPRQDECASLVGELDDYIRSESPTEDEHLDAGSIRFNGPLQSYYHSRTFEEILLARRFFKKRPPSNNVDAFVFACLLHILHGNRPYALSRRSHPITPFAPSGKSEYKI